MASKSLCSSLSLSLSSSSPALSLLGPNQSFLSTKPRTVRFSCRKLKKGGVFAMGREGYDQNFQGRRVDESMIVLRKRIHEMKMAERNYEAPADWMEWEKRYYTSYDSGICKAVGILQAQLMNMRPSMALGMIGLITLSVPTSTVLVTLHLIDAVNSILSGIH